MDTTVTVETPTPETPAPSVPSVVVVTQPASTESTTETETETSKILELAEKVGALTVIVESFRSELAGVKADVEALAHDLEAEAIPAEEVIPLTPEIPVTPQDEQAPRKTRGLLATILLGR